MTNQLKTSFEAAAIIIGTIVGVGIFGLPYVFAKVGFLLGISIMIIIGIAALVLNLLYGEIALRSRRKKRLVGYAKDFLGSKGKMIATISALFGLLSSQLAYLIVGGEFLSFLSENLLGWSGNLTFYVIIFLIIASTVIYKKSSMLAAIEFFMSLFLIAVIGLIFVSSLPKIELQKLINYNPHYLFQAYGVILFAMSGSIAIPEVVEYLKKQKNAHFKRVISVGTFLPVILYGLFTLAVVGMLGKNVSQSAITSLKSVLGEKIIVVGALFGILAVFTSFIMIGKDLMKVLWYDYRFPKVLACLLVNLIPFLFFIIGFRNFVNVIGVAGAIMGGINGILIILIYKKARQKRFPRPIYSVKLPRLAGWLLIIMFLSGIFYQIVNFF
jgi:tyrosine-specific transport protein